MQRPHKWQYPNEKGNHVFRARNYMLAGQEGGLVHFSAGRRVLREKRRPKTWTCPLLGQISMHFVVPDTKILTSPEFEPRYKPVPGSPLNKRILVRLNERLMSRKCPLLGRQALLFITVQGTARGLALLLTKPAHDFFNPLLARRGVGLYPNGSEIPSIAKTLPHHPQILRRLEPETPFRHLIIQYADNPCYVSVRRIHTCHACYAGVLQFNSPGRQVMGRPPAGLDEYLDWQQRLEIQKASGLSVPMFCLQEGVSCSTFYRWTSQLRDGIPESLVAEKVAREQAETAPAMFLPVSLKASPVELQLPNGGVVRLPLGIGQAALIEAIRVVGTLRPWKSPNS